MSEVDDRIDEMRDIINKPRKETELTRNMPMYNQLCSSLDVIGDTEEAIAAYANQECGNSTGALYIATYGVLQALFVQQDATFNLAEALGFSDHVENYPDLKDIRDTRNPSVGHPTKQDRGKKGTPTAFHFISRISLHYGGFKLMSCDGIGNDKFRDIALTQLIERQRAIIRQILTDLVAKLKLQEDAHKAHFAGQRLEDIFNHAADALNTIDLTDDKPSPEGIVLGNACLKDVKRILRDFKTALEKRGETCDSVRTLDELLHHHIARLTTYFQSDQVQPAGGVSHAEAQISLVFVQKHLGFLEQIARDLDEEYTVA